MACPCLVWRPQGLPRQVWEQGKLPVGQVPPGQLALELGGSAAGFLGVPQQPAWAELAKVEVGRQTAGVGGVRPAGLLLVPVHT